MTSPHGLASFEEPVPALAPGGNVLAYPSRERCVSIVTEAAADDPRLPGMARALAAQSLLAWQWSIAVPAGASLDAPWAEGPHHDPRIDVVAPLEPVAGHGVPYLLHLAPGELLEPTALEKWVWYLASHPEHAFVEAYRTGLERTFGLVRLSATDTVALDPRELGSLAELLAGRGLTGGVVPEVLVSRTEYAPVADPAPALLRADSQDEDLRMRASFAPPPLENRQRKHGPRLLLVLPWVSVGGADKFNLDLLEQLTARGWDVSIATTMPSQDHWLGEFARSTSDIFMLHRFLRLADYPRFLRYLIRSRGIDVVLVANSELGYALLPYLRSQAPETAFVDFCHSAQEDWQDGGYPRLAVWWQDLIDLNVVSSRYLERWMIERGADASQIEVCYTSIDAPGAADLRVETRAELGVTDATPIVLYVARISEEKQPLVFARTMGRLRDAGRRFRAVVAGDGPELGALSEAVAALGLEDSVALLGATPPQRVRALMASADIFFLPSQREGIALTLFEAMAAGVPVVAADVGGQHELVADGCGVLVARGDEAEEVERYASVLGELLGDPARREAMGLAARTRVAQGFRLEQMGERMAALLDRAREVHRSEPRPAPSQGLGFASAMRAVEYTSLLEEHVAAQRRHGAWVAEVERAGEWHADQRERWQRVAEDQSQTIERQVDRLAELEQRAASLEEEAEPGVDRTRAAPLARLGRRLTGDR